MKSDCAHVRPCVALPQVRALAGLLPHRPPERRAGMQDTPLPVPDSPLERIMPRVNVAAGPPEDFHPAGRKESLNLIGLGFGEKPAGTVTPFRALPVMSARESSGKAFNRGTLADVTLNKSDESRHEALERGCAIIPALGQTPSIQAAASSAETVSAINYAILFRLPA